MGFDDPDAIIDNIFANQTLDLKRGARVQGDSGARGNTSYTFKDAPEVRIT